MDEEASEAWGSASEEDPSDNNKTQQESVQENTNNQDVLGDLLGPLDHNNEHSSKSDNPSNLLHKRTRETQEKSANQIASETLDTQNNEASRYDHIQELDKLLSDNNKTSMNEGYVKICMLSFHVILN